MQFSKYDFGLVFDSVLNKKTAIFGSVFTTWCLVCSIPNC